jgi:large subunit ribosomal protein L23
VSQSQTSIIRRPLITEKSTVQKEMSNQVAFEVDRRANKIEIQKAVESQFGVKVIKVRTANFRGKKVRYGRTMGRKSDWKRALVTLAPGERIEFFEGA